VTEAGGKWTDFRGFPSNVYKEEILTTNGLVHEQMVAVLKKASK
jgi:fructose-1,6-bisphosphatase/inositol monophosphatase family enzyme